MAVDQNEELKGKAKSAATLARINAERQAKKEANKLAADIAAGRVTADDMENDVTVGSDPVSLFSGNLFTDKLI